MNQSDVMANFPTAKIKVAISYHRDLNAVTSYQIEGKASPWRRIRPVNHQPENHQHRSKGWPS